MRVSGWVKRIHTFTRNVIPAQAGIHPQASNLVLDSRLRGNDAPHVNHPLGGCGRKTVARYFMLFAAGMLAIGAWAATPTLEQVGNQVYCQCGCVTTLNHCPHLPAECRSRAEMQSVILTDVKQGKDDKGILADLVDRYGVHVLASPPAAGFDLTVWVLPAVGLLVGLFIVLLMVRRWRLKNSAGKAPASDAPIDPRIMAAVDEEMHKMETTKD